MSQGFLVLTAAYQRNGEPITAEAFYAIACDPRRSVAVEACAGSGKTWMLVSRIVRALLEGADPITGAVKPHEILAITFTKKAAGEMRSRLDEWLHQFAHADDAALQKELAMRGVHSTHPAAKNAQDIDEKGVSRSKDGREPLSNLYRAVLASGRSVQIKTFHGWFAGLLRSAPVAVLQRLELPLDYELLEDDSPARALVWRRFYAAVLTDSALQADFESVVHTHGRFQASRAWHAVLDKRAEFLLADEAGTVASSVATFDELYPDFAGLAAPEAALTQHPANRQLLQDAARALGRASAPTFSAKGAALEQALAAGDMDALFDALLTAAGTARKFGDKIVGIALIRQAQDLVLRAQAACQQHAAWVYQHSMARLARVLIAEFTRVKRERGWVDMNDVERAASTLLRDPELSGWVQERLDARVRHLMIDEFQDTNPLQWQALYSWLQSYGGAGNAPSVFLVGDPKQSIYRFRRAEPQVFMAAKAFLHDELRGDILACDHTRRNTVAVINTVNTVMAAATAADGYEGFRAHTTAVTTPGLVGRLPPILRPANVPADSDGHAPQITSWRNSLNTPRELPEETLRTHEARQAAAWVQSQIAAGLKPQDVMVLSRRRAGLLPLQLELRALNIAAQVGEKTRLIDCYEVLDIVALLDVLCSPRHDLSMAQVLRSPLFGLTDSALVQLALLQREHTLPWYDLLQKSELLTPDLIAPGPNLARWKSWVDRFPPHDALQRIYDDGDVLARFVAASPPVLRRTVVANLNALLASSLELDGGRYATPYALVRSLKAGNLQAPAALNLDAVRLLTIHGAKGLEAEAVLLLDTDTPERAVETMGVLIDWPGEAAAPTRFVFLASETRPPACAADLLAIEQAARRREELNALYVALTRARRTLVASSITPHRDAPASWWRRLFDALPELATPVPVHVAAAAAQSATLRILPRLPDQAALPATQMIAPADEALAARIGQALHRLLEWGGTASDMHVVAVAREFVLSPEQAWRAAVMAQRIVTGEGAWAWQLAVIGWQGNEVGLLQAGQLMRLDRLVQRKDAGHNGHWWVLDYKSAQAPELQPALLAQLRAYRNAVQSAYPAAVVKAAFLTSLGTVIEVVDQAQVNVIAHEIEPVP